MHTTVSNHCLNCNIETSNSKFCSKSCAATYNNQKHPKRKIEGKCKYCDKPAKSGRNTCGSRECIRASYDILKKEHKVPIKDSVRSYYTRQKQLAVNYKGGKCQICGYNKCLSALEFHHLDSTQKDFTISGGAKSFSKMKSELDKCMLLCSNCHREVHSGLVALEGTDPSSMV